METCQIGIFSLRHVVTRNLFCLAKGAFRFLLFPVHLQRFFAISFGECCFSCASDGALLGEN